jgi:hypothetical protein
MGNQEMLKSYGMWKEILIIQAQEDTGELISKDVKG